MMAFLVIKIPQALEPSEFLPRSLFPPKTRADGHKPWTESYGLVTKTPKINLTDSRLNDVGFVDLDRSP
jgi:hypothetical protein